MAARRLNEKLCAPESPEQHRIPHRPNGASSERIKRKRHRVPIACFNCRALKTKCDGSRPTCSTCVANGDECQYSSKGISGSSNLVTVNQEYLRTLEQRLNRLEREQSQDMMEDVASPISNADMLPPTPASRSAAIPPSNLSRAGPYRWPQPTSSVSSNTQVPTTRTNESPMLVSADPDVFMGGVSFTQLILNAMNSRTIGIRAQSFSSNRDEIFSSVSSAIFELPSEASELIRYFFDFHHQLSPIFHEPTILASIENVINCDLLQRRNYRYTLAITNMILAVCLSHRRLDVKTNPGISRRYYDIAMNLLAPTLLCDWSIEKVQALILGARYLQCSNSPDECWNVLGLAIRIAYGLELHHPPADEDNYTLKETKKRVWYACFTLDKLLSMIYRRPAATSSSEFSCPLPEDLDDECIYQDRILKPTPKRASSMSFSIEVAKLYCVLESATRLSDLETASGEALAQSVLSLDEKYQKWYNELPSQLKLSEMNELEKPLILALRANMVRILIHRPSLALTLRALSENGDDSRSSEGLKSSILQYSRNICVTTAIETINLISRRHEQTQKRSGTSWFNLYYLFNAILILVSHVVDPKYHNDKPALAQLDTALNMIKSLSCDHMFAQKAYIFLQQLLSCMDKSLSLGKMNWDFVPIVDQGSVVEPMPRIGTQARSRDAIDGGVDNVGDDMFSLLEFTHELTETYSTLGSEMWLWADEQNQANTRLNIL